MINLRQLSATTDMPVPKIALNNRNPGTSRKRLVLEGNECLYSRCTTQTPRMAENAPLRVGGLGSKSGIHTLLCSRNQPLFDIYVDNVWMGRFQIKKPKKQNPKNRFSATMKCFRDHETMRKSTSCFNLFWKGSNMVLRLLSTHTRRIGEGRGRHGPRSA